MKNFTTKKIYFLKSSGRFGNQIFQILHVISDLNNDSVIIAFNFSSTEKILSTNHSNIHFFECKGLLDRIITKIFKLFLKYKIFSVIEQNTLETEAGLIHATNKKFIPGMFKNCIVIKGYFQSYKFVRKIKKDFFRISDKKQIKSSGFIFVHFRKTDYREIFLLNKSVVLDFSYYEKSINYFTSINPHTKFLLFSDEILSTNELNLFNGYEYKISNLTNPTEIYEEMLTCSGGIICNSTLSWLAGFHLKKLDKKASLVAPFNHLGHNIDIEIPEGINNDNFIYL